MAAKFLTEIEELLKCSLCLDDLDNPRVLPCLHRFCFSCLNELLDKNRLELHCPLCRMELDIPSAGAEGFPSDFVVLTLLEKVQMKRKLDRKCMSGTCGHCGENYEYTAVCFTCMCYLCEACHELHSRKAFQDHRVIKIDHLEFGDAMNISEAMTNIKRIPKCAKHNDQVPHMRCKDCDGKLICPACTLLEHRDHNLESVSDAAKRMSNEISDYLNDLPVLAGKIRERNGEIDQIRQTLVQTVVDVSNQTREECKEKNTTVNKKCNSTINYKTAEIKKEIEQFREKIKELEEQVEIHEQTLAAEKENAEKERDHTTQKLISYEGTLIRKLEIFLHQQLRALEEREKSVTWVLKRFENSMATATAATKSTSDWVKITSMPNISQALKELKDQMYTMWCDFKNIRYRMVVFLPSPNESEVGNIMETDETSQKIAIVE